MRGLGRLIEEHPYCIEVLSRIASITANLQTVAIALMSEHLQQCLAQATTNDAPATAVNLHEASKAIARLVRS